jgi:hypothetical protein
MTAIDSLAVIRPGRPAGTGAGREADGARAGASRAAEGARP